MPKKNLRLSTEHQGRVFLVVITISLIGILLVIRPFISTIAIAVIMTLLFNPVYLYLDKRLKANTTIKVILVTLLFLAIVIIPLVLIIASIIAEAPNIVAAINEYLGEETLDHIKSELEQLIEQLNINPRAEEVMNQILDSLSSFIAVLVNSIGAFLVDFITGLISSIIPLFTNIIIFIAVFFTLLPNLNSVLKHLERLSPFDRTISNMFIDRLTGTTKSMVLASLVISMASGFIIGLLFWMLGLPFPGLVTLASIVLGFIPLVGPSIITIPVSVILILQGAWPSALLILGVHFFIINNIDLIIRPYFISEEYKINPVLMGISVLGGIATFGILGVIYGPLIVILFQTCIEIYTENFSGGKVLKITEKKED